MAVKMKNIIPFLLVGSDVLLIISVLTQVQFWWNNFKFFSSLLVYAFYFQLQNSSKAGCNRV